ncbi:MAG: peptidoglycan DD-metalloendopeptidase family protein [Candidatus Pacebacteria bacterium]|nr:peptidoglycan DD-metalloendopeptidase family protein [Candidatus Paceibacterota bacterium]
MKYISKILATLVLVFLITLISHIAFADQTPLSYTPLTTLPGITKEGIASSGVHNYLSGVFALVIALAGALAVLILVVGGVQYVASGITPDQKGRAKERIKNALIGLALILGSWLILNSINPALKSPALQSLPPVGVEASLQAIKDQQAMNEKILKDFADFAKEQADFEASAGQQQNFVPSYTERTGPGVAGYVSPVPSSGNCLTQPFGYTSYALESGIYPKNFHDGIDFGVGSGTEIKSIANGEVVYTGNCGDKTFGKWVYIKHDDPLGTSALYAHLKDNSIPVGTKVAAGQKIALSGNSGPPGMGSHLHATLFNSSAVGFGSPSCGPNFPRASYPKTNPISAEYTGYLDMEKYLGGPLTMCINSRTGSPFAR